MDVYERWVVEGRKAPARIWVENVREVVDSKLGRVTVADEVDAEGITIDRTWMVSPGLIKSRKPAHMSLHYGKLEITGEAS